MKSLVARVEKLEAATSPDFSKMTDAQLDALIGPDAAILRRMTNAELDALIEMDSAATDRYMEAMWAKYQGAPIG